METIDNLASSVHGAVDRIAGATTHGAAALRDQGRHIRNAEQRFVENARGYTRDRPVISLGIAAAAGFVLSRLFGSRQTVSKH
jgi:ElaB/YqjD/DUF883 family membrane-anchored ribosome-binding protein